MAARGRLDDATAAARRDAIRGARDYETLAGADLVVEAVFEDLDVKEGVFRALDRAMKQGALIATNTSTLDIDKLAAFTARPADVVGMHFFSPANVMRLLEVVRSKATSPGAIATAMEVGRAIGKVPVLAGNCDGFIGNRMLDKYITEAMAMVEEGASPLEVDTALTRFGLAMGPFAVLDLAGLDVSWRIRQRRLAEGRSYGSPLMDLFHQAGRFGQKTGRGFYRYESGNRAPLPDAEADAIVAAFRAALGGRARTVPEVEIAKRCVYALVNEGANILADGIALRAGDIDVVYVYGYGFPAWRGGPMKYAELRGLAAVLGDISIFETRFGERWRAAPLLKRLVAEGERGWPRSAGVSATPECEQS
jgi:3-hydroxyacyl-CoA dehydrogenase